MSTTGRRRSTSNGASNQAAHVSKSRKHIAQLEELSARLEEAERARWLAEARAQQERQAFESLASFASSKLGYDWAAFDEDGDWYEGFVHPGSHTPDGWGVCIFSDDGGCYIGEFDSGRPSGHGKMTFGQDGSSYNGQFKNGCYHGEGKYTSRKGDVFRGHWRNDKRHGYGLHFMADGMRVFEEEYNAGVLITRRARNEYQDAMHQANTVDPDAYVHTPFRARDVHGHTERRSRAKAYAQHVPPSKQQYQQWGKENQSPSYSRWYKQFQAEAAGHGRREQQHRAPGSSRRHSNDTAAATGPAFAGTSQTQTPAESSNGIRMRDIPWPNKSSSIIEEHAGPRAGMQELQRAMKALQKEWHPDRWQRVHLLHSEQDKILEEVKKVFQRIMDEKARLGL